MKKLKQRYVSKIKRRKLLKQESGGVKLQHSTRPSNYNKAIVDKRKFKKRKSPQQKKVERFESRRRKFLNKLTMYNNTKGLSKVSDKLAMYPRTPSELKRFNRVLDKAIKGDKSKALRELKAKNKESLFRASHELDRQLAKKYNTNLTHKDYIYHNTSIKEARRAGLNELAEILEKGGVNLTLELSAIGFTIVEYSDSYKESASEHSHEMIYKKLLASSKYLSSRTNILIRDSLNELQKDLGV